MKLEDMYSTIPRSLQTQLLVRAETDEADEEVMKKRQKMVETMKPAELAEIR